MQQHALRSFCHSTRVPKGMQRETPRKIEARERQRNGKLKKGEDCWWNTCSTAYLPPPFLSWTMINKQINEQTNKTATKQQHGNGERLLLPLSVTSITFSNNSNKATKKTSRTKARSTHNYLKRNGNFFRRILRLSKWIIVIKTGLKLYRGFHLQIFNYLARTAAEKTTILRFHLGQETGLSHLQIIRSHFAIIFIKMSIYLKISNSEASRARTCEENTTFTLTFLTPLWRTNSIMGTKV